MPLPLRDFSPGDTPDPIPVTPAAGRRPGGLRAMALATASFLAAGVLGVVVVGGGAAEAGTVGAGSYTETKPGSLTLPEGCGDIATNPRLFTTADAPKGPVPTNDWWSSLIWKRYDCSYSEPLHAHPATYDTQNNGLSISYNTTPTITGSTTGGTADYFFYPKEDLRVGIVGMSAPVVKAADWSDWTVTADWTDGTRNMRATIGHGLPFSYYKVKGGNAQILTTGDPTVWANSNGMLGLTVGANNYVVYGPSGATWNLAGSSITSNLAGKDYFSVAVLPVGADKQQFATEYGKYAHAHITGTKANYTYNPATGDVDTTYEFVTTPQEGTETRTVAALYPHQWRYLAGGTPVAETYTTPRGKMKTLVGISSFTTSMKYNGVLPEVPAVGDSSGADLTTITNYLNAELANPEGSGGADTYWVGKGLGRAARVAEIADQLGITTVRDKAIAQIKARLTDWLTASPNETANLFYYDKNWGTMIGAPANYFSDKDLNDHHFHWGYFIAAAATLAKFEPDWAKDTQYGGMIDLLIRDANNYDRNDTMFPYLRDFDVYAGHDWASGLACFQAGNNQESSSEGMNFANAVIQWGQATGNPAVRDAGIYIYTTQAQAIAEYWFDVHDENFPEAFPRSTVGMAWGMGAAYATWFSADPEMIQGINMLPVTGGHLYLGNYPDYVTKNYDELVKYNNGPPTVWQDIIWEFLATGDGDRALTAFRGNPNFTSEEGESKAHTFHWIRNLAALGNVDNTITANHPLARVFKKGTARTYVASNITANPLTVTFSDGTELTVPAGKTKASGALNWSGGTATGGVDMGTPPTGTTPPTTTPPASTPPASTPPATTPPATTPPATTPPPSLSPTQYLLSGGELGGTAGTAGTVSVAAANGTNDGTPTNPQVFTANGLTGTYNGGSTGFDLAVDAGTTVGNGVQARVSYDLTGDGSFDRVETYNYYATDPVTGVEHYKQTQGLKSATGTLGDLVNGTVKVEVWNAIGSGATDLGIGNASTLVLPYTGASPTVSPSPTGSVPPGTFSPDMYLTGQTLSGTAGNSANATVTAANGNWVGSPHNPVVYTATGVTATYAGGQTRFDMFLDAGTNVGDGTHVRVSYDLTGDGTFDRVETYNYYATDPVTGWEHYTDAKGLYSGVGTLGDLANGTVKVEVWNAIGNTDTTLGIGNQSKLTLPYTG